MLYFPEDAYLAVTLRAFDPKAALWSIWWLDGRLPGGPIDPPVKGAFHHGVGTSYANDTFPDKPIRVRFIWSRITPTHATGNKRIFPAEVNLGRQIEKWISREIKMFMEARDSAVNAGGYAI